MKKIIKFIGVLFIASIILAGCGENEKVNKTLDQDSLTDEDKRKLKVVTTIFPQYDFVREIGKDDVDLEMLLKPGAESHSFDPTPQDIKLIQGADLFIYVGGENDTWVENLLSSMEDKPETMKLVDLVDTVEEEIVEGMEHEHDHDEGHDHDDHDHDHDDHDHDHEDHDRDHDEDHDHDEHDHEIDEHVWTSPAKAMEIVEKISEKMSELDKENAEKYKENARIYIKKLKELDNSFKEVVERGKRKSLVFGDRFPFRYFVDRYDLDYYAAFPGCSADTDANPKTVAFLINKVKEDNIPTVLTIEFSNGKIADSITDATGAKKLIFHSVHNISADELEAGESYLSLMEKNVQVLKEALN